MKSLIPIYNNGWSLLVCTAAMTASLYGTNLRFSLLGNSNNQRLGSSIVAMGDLNGDGYPDLAVGDPGYTVAGVASTYTGSGQVLVISGKNGSTLFTLQGTPANDQAFGTSLAAIRADADSKLDIVVGAPGGSGAVWIYSGATGSLLRTIASPLPTASSSFGISLADAGDQNADGVADLFVGAPGATMPDGRVVIISGATGAVIMQLGVGVADTGFGTSVASVPDQNGDGRAELVVGSPKFSSGLGRVQILVSSNGVQLAEHVGTIPGARLGSRVGINDDRNGDGTRDLIAGSGSGGSGYLLSGTTMAVITDLTLAGAAADLPVVPGGSLDIDGDGDTELLVGYPGALPVARFNVIPEPVSPQPAVYHATVANSGLGFAIAVIPGFGFAVGEPLRAGGAVHVYTTLKDDDKDGVPNKYDHCRKSIRTATVVFQKVDSRVKNRLNGDGCTFADLFARLRPAKGWTSHAQFVLKANALIKKLRAAGLISKSESTKLKTAVVNCKIGVKKG